jgi:hypothetical protein
LTAATGSIRVCLKREWSGFRSDKGPDALDHDDLERDAAENRFAPFLILL